MRERIERRRPQFSGRSTIAKAALLAASTMIISVSGSEANTIQWVASQGDITQSSNWAGNVLPGVNDIGAINNAGEADISGNEGLTLGELRVGDQGGSNYGLLVQTGGTITDTNWLAVGRDASGVYQMSGGSLVKTGGGDFLILGGNSSQVGTMALSGNASVVLSNSGTFADGDGEFFGNGNAQLFMQDTASINMGGSQFWVGNNPNTSGSIIMTGGTITDSAWISVGRTGGTGTIDMSGGTIDYTGDNGNHFIVGDSNNGASIGTGLINQSGGAISSPNGDFWLGSSGNGTYNISGGTLTTLGLDIAINGGSAGMLNLNGGSVSSTVVVHGSGSGGINFNGGVLQALQSNAAFLQNFTSSQLNIESGGAIFDTGGYTNTISTGFSGVGGFTLQGSGGSLTLNASNTYGGDTTVNGGTLIIGTSGTLGAGVNVNLSAGALAISSDSVVAGKTLNFNGGALQFENYNSSAISFSNVPNLMLGAATGTASTFSGKITGTESLTYVGPGTLNLTNTANTYSGGTFINNGVLQAVPGSLGSGAITVSGTGLLGISSDASIPGSLVFNGGGISFNNYSSALNFHPGLNLTLGAAVGTASTLTGNITDGPSSATSLTYVGPGTLILQGTNTFTGGTNISQGILNVAANSLGSGAILLNGGTLQYATGNTTDYTASPFNLTIGAGGGTIDTNGNNVSFAGNISPAAGLGTAIPGTFQKAGAGTLTLNGSLSATVFFVHQGSVVLAGTAQISTATSPVSGADDYSSIGLFAGDVGTLTLSGSSSYIAAGDFNVGDNNASSGTVNVQNNATLQIRTLGVGKFGTAVGVVNQTGGTVIEADNGASPGDWRIGGIGSAADSTAVGVYNLSGGNFNTGGGANLQIGAYGQGTFIQSGGSVSTGQFLSIGRYATGIGVYNMSGGTLTANTQPVSVVGEQGNGTLLLSGSASYTTKELLISQNDGATGVVQQTGGTMTAPNGVAIGQNQTGNLSAPASGVYNLAGGVLATSSISQFSSPNITSTVYFNGGTLQATLNNASLLSGLTHAYVQAGGLTLNASIGSVSLSQPLLHDPTVGASATDGGLTLVGGQLTMNAPSNTYTGATNITGGGLLVAGAINTLSPASAINISAGTLDVTGYNNSIAAITVGSAGILDLSTTNNAVLSDGGAANFNGTLLVAGSAPATLPYTLITYGSYAGSFASASLPTGTFLDYTPTALLLTNGTSAANLVYRNNAMQWDTANTPAFNGSSGPTVFHSGDNVTFDDSTPSGPYTVTISGAVSPGSTTFNNSVGNYVVTAANSSSGIAGSGALLKLGTGSVSLSGFNSYTGGTTVALGTLTIASANAFPANTALNISTGAKVVIANHSSGSVFVPVTSSFSNAGTVDITNNAMVLHGATYGTIFSEVAAAYHNGAWNGTNASSGVITSSDAATDGSHLTAVGVATGLTSFPDGSVVSSDVVLKYTYYGDANLDGRVDGTDYSRIDNGYLTGATGWFNGDFNYDGVINGSDYTLIDNAFNRQGVSLAAEMAAPTAQFAGGVSAVPEPASIGLSALAALGLLRRRPRRQ